MVSTVSELSGKCCIMTEQPKPEKPLTPPAEAPKADAAPASVPPPVEDPKILPAKRNELDEALRAIEKIIEEQKPAVPPLPVEKSIPAEDTGLLDAAKPVNPPVSPTTNPLPVNSPTTKLIPSPESLGIAKPQPPKIDMTPVQGVGLPVTSTTASNATSVPPEVKSAVLSGPNAKPTGENKPPASAGTQKITQRFGTDPNLAAGGASGTICPTCGHRNRPGVLICDNCGTHLIGGVAGAIGTRDLPGKDKEAEKPMDADLVKEIKKAGTAVFDDEMVLKIEIEGGTTPMLVYPKQEIFFGRRDPNSGTLPDVDLTAYAGYRMGVSRRHASLRLQDRQLSLSDLGSSNGTFLNGSRLVAHRPYPVRDGDEIRLGQMVLKVFFQNIKNKP